MKAYQKMSLRNVLEDVLSDVNVSQGDMNKVLTILDTADYEAIVILCKAIERIKVKYANKANQNQEHVSKGLKVCSEILNMFANYNNELRATCDFESTIDHLEIASQLLENPKET